MKQVQSPVPKRASVAPLRAAGSQPMAEDMLPTWEHPPGFNPILLDHDVGQPTRNAKSPIRKSRVFRLSIKSATPTGEQSPTKRTSSCAVGAPAEVSPGVDLVIGSKSRFIQPIPLNVSPATFAKRKKEATSPKPCGGLEEIVIPFKGATATFVAPLTPTFSKPPKSWIIENDQDTGNTRLSPKKATKQFEFDMIFNAASSGKHLRSLGGTNRRDIVLSPEKLSPLPKKRNESTCEKLNLHLRNEHPRDNTTARTISTCSTSTYATYRKGQPTAQRDLGSKAQSNLSLDSSESSINSYYFRQSGAANEYYGGPLSSHATDKADEYQGHDDTDNDESVCLALYEQENEMVRMALELSRHDVRHDSGFSDHDEGDSFYEGSYKSGKQMYLDDSEYLEDEDDDDLKTAIALSSAFI